MTNDQLRALADALEPMARAPRFEDFDVQGFCAWVRACADAQSLPGLAPTHRCPACGAFWRQCDDASWNLRSASCCGLCDAGRVELVCWLDEPKREALTDERITKGEYVLATKWGDGDPGDHWGVGFYDRFENGRHYVVDSAGKQIRGNGFRRVGRITVDVGRWLLSAANALEASPPGTVNLWKILTERARRIGGSDE